MGKKLLVVLLGLALTFSLFGCNNTTQVKEGPWEPSETIQFVCQSGAGGGSDIMARTIAQNMSQLGLIKKPIVVDNITGSGGVKAFTHTLSKAGSPYVWQTVNSNFFVAPITGNTDKYYADFTILAVIGGDPNILCTAADSPYNTLEEVLAAAKANPMGVSIMIGSAGSSGSVTSAMLEGAADVKMTQVPFEGGGDGLAAVMGQQVDLAWQGIGEVMSAVDGGLMKVLAITSEERSSALPDVPTFKELGYDVVYEVPRAVAAPPNMSPEAKAFYTDAFVKLNASEEWQKNYIESNFIIPTFAVGDEAVAMIKETHDKTLEVFKTLGLANVKYQEK